MTAALDNLLHELEQTVCELTAGLEKGIPVTETTKRSPTATHPAASIPVAKFSPTFDALQDELDQLNNTLRRHPHPPADSAQKPKPELKFGGAHQRTYDDRDGYGQEEEREISEKEEEVISFEEEREDEKEKDDKPIGLLLKKGRGGLSSGSEGEEKPAKVEKKRYHAATSDDEKPLQVSSPESRIHQFQKLVTTVHAQYKASAQPPSQKQPPLKAYVHADKIKTALQKMQEASIVKMTIRIYIADYSHFKTLQITSQMTVGMIMKYLREKGCMDESDDWALFEVVDDYGVERAVREWEILTDVVGSWELDSSNRLILVKYPLRDTLTASSVTGNSYPQLYGWLHVEMKKGKWQKRFVYWRDDCLYHSKDNKGTNETLLCSIKNYDVCYIKRPLRKSPTKFMFALKSQERARIYENTEDYVHFLCAEHFDKMKDWVLSIRVTKNQHMYEQYPDRVKDPLKPIPRPPISADILSSRSPSPRSPSVPRSTPTARSPAAVHSPKISSSPPSSAPSPHPSSPRPIPGSRSRVHPAPSSKFDMSHSPAAIPKGKRMSPSEAERRMVENGSPKLVHLEEGIKFSEGSLLSSSPHTHSPLSAFQVHTSTHAYGHGSPPPGQGIEAGRTLINFPEERPFKEGSLLAKERKVTFA
ncbi:uncharacterized protein VTP21DRAFT_1464 [Calcarisporiella thermophila]|uniref:uncharacterized protein n=1 Tax=Calcarisporiella thermophila TaxID=911321 RepID=UPI003742F0EE